MTSPALKMVNEILHSNEKTQEKPRFIEAKEIALYSQETPDSQYNPLAHKYKGIVNAEKPTQIFNVVGKDYKLLQHGEMYDIVEKTVKQLGFKANIKTFEFNEGARLRMELTFPDLFLRIGPTEVNDIVQFRMSFDNSYNATTGLRAAIDGLRLKCLNGQTVPDSFAFFYHRHTKGMDVNNIIPTIEKGVEVFQTKLKEKFDRYYATKIDPSKAKDFLQECHDKKVISQKYLQMMLQRVGFGGDIDIRGLGQITNQWMLYNLVTETMTHGCESKDTQESAVKKMDDAINANIKNLVMA